jgi:predicted ATPase
MRFRMVGRRNEQQALDTCFLEQDNWDDFGYRAQFLLSYRDANRVLHDIGMVKIAQFELASPSYFQGRFEPVAVSLPAKFERLPDAFFSLGQHSEYYERLNALGPETRDAVLSGLRDIASDLALFSRTLAERVTEASLLRSVPRATVENQFHRLTAGGAKLSKYSFTYTYPDGPELPFVVDPESHPPSNVHVIIGSNGVGKSWLLNQLATLLLKPAQAPGGGVIRFQDSEPPASSRRRSATSRPGMPQEDLVSQFAGLVSVAFSAFDEFEPLSARRNRADSIIYNYVGLKTPPDLNGDDASGKIKNGAALAEDFAASVGICRRERRQTRWLHALSFLDSDPLIADMPIAELAAVEHTSESRDAAAKEIFRQLSSGHRAVLLTLTRLVECVEERSLVLLDEPESHLHPPLLSAFIRALSDLLMDRNGVAIIATHSPIILQEVPKSCVSVLRRSGHQVTADRPTIETFGENVGTLTSEVFGLEVTKSGFHAMLTEAVSGKRSVQEVLDAFDSQLGSEARALVYALLAMQAQR